MRKLLAALLLLAPLPAAAQNALVVGCEEGSVVLENYYEPGAGVGPTGEKVLPLHMLLTRPGTFVLEFRSEEPFALYAYRYDTRRRNWEFLPSSAVARISAEEPETPHSWATTVRKPDAQSEDYLFQAQPLGEAQETRHRFLHVRRTSGCR